MNIPQFSIQNYQFTITAFVFLLAMGLSAYFSMPPFGRSCFRYSGIYGNCDLSGSQSAGY